MSLIESSLKHDFDLLLEPGISLHLSISPARWTAGKAPRAYYRPFFPRSISQFSAALPGSFPDIEIEFKAGEAEDWPSKLDHSAGIKFFPFQCFSYLLHGSEIDDFQNIRVL
jgi:hypothetical protein